MSENTEACTFCPIPASVYKYSFQLPRCNFKAFVYKIVVLLSFLEGKRVDPSFKFVRLIEQSLYELGTIFHSVTVIRKTSVIGNTRF